MPDPTNDKDIDELLWSLSICADRYSCHTLPSDVAVHYHAALTALIAERNALKQRIAELEDAFPRPTLSRCLPLEESISQPFDHIRSLNPHRHPKKEGGGA